MKQFCFVFSMFISTTPFAQFQDTVFLKREVADTPYQFYHAIFIDTTTEYKKALTNFAFNVYDSAMYFDQLTNLKPLKRNMTAGLKGFPQKWISLHKWKDNYYLYAPLDFGYHYRFAITDSTTIDYTMEGPEPSILNKIQYIAPTKIVIERTNSRESNSLQIQVIDTEKGIAIFTFSPTKNNKTNCQRLMVDASKAHLFSTIVNYCPTNRLSEFEFDAIDFKELSME